MANNNQVHITLQPETLAKALANALGTVELEISGKEVSYMLAEKVCEMTGDFDDAGCEWTTTAEGHFCIDGEPEWLISKNKHIGILVDAINILRYGMVLKVEQRMKVEKRAQKVASG